MAIKDLTGKSFGRLTVLRLDKVIKRNAHWFCECSCPAKTLVSIRGDCLRNGNTTSCGCKRLEAVTKHGHNAVAQLGRPSRTYISWQGMMPRCNNPQHKQFRNYGALGVTVCERWYDFQNFLLDMGECPEGYSLDRYPDPHGNYEPGNCRWATRTQQARNKRKNHMLTLDNRTQCIAAWAEELGILRHTLQSRVKYGWDDVRILTTPVKHHNRRS